MTATPEKVFVTGFKSLPVGPTLEQNEIATWLESAMTRVHGRSPADAKQAIQFMRRLDRGGAIARRSVCVEDYQSTDPAAWKLFKPDGSTPWFKPSLERRMTIYQETAERLAFAAFKQPEPPPRALIQVTCTGYQSPSALQRLVVARAWGEGCHLLQLGHMGCYAAIPAVRTAALNARDKGRCGVLHVELCSLHLDLETTDLEQMVVHHLFADGAVRYDVCLESESDGPRFELLDTFEWLLPGCADAMTWKLGSQGFRMSLGKDVPRIIARAVPGIVSKALAKLGLYRKDVARWAIHPGGPRVVGDLAQSLELDDPRMTSHSLAVLRERGNMSSATLPHIWEAMLADPEVQTGDLIVSLAFGPGLTVTGNILRKEA